MLLIILLCGLVALRKESVDRNPIILSLVSMIDVVALRKESVDRNIKSMTGYFSRAVALRKESVDRNIRHRLDYKALSKSLSARRAWIEILPLIRKNDAPSCRSPQGERG